MHTHSNICKHKRTFTLIHTHTILITHAQTLSHARTHTNTHTYSLEDNMHAHTDSNFFKV